MEMLIITSLLQSTLYKTNNFIILYENSKYCTPKLDSEHT